MNQQNRRGFLRLALASVACGTASCGQTSLPPTSGGGGAGGPGTAPTTGEPGAGSQTADVSAGKASDLAVGSIVALGTAPIFIARDASGIYAMTTTCTHQGCDLGSEGEVVSGRIICGCHGAQFDANGGVLQGPARSPLAHFAVAVDGQGNITVHSTSEVAADVRSPV